MTLLVKVGMNFFPLIYICYSLCSIYIYIYTRTRVSLRLFFPLFLLRATCDMRFARASNFALAAVAAPCSIPVLSRFALILALRARSRASRSRGTAAPPRLRATRPPTPIPCTHCPNEYLCQCGSRSVQSFGRLCWICGVHRIVPMSVCDNFRPYTGHVMLCARLRAHGCTLALADPLSSLSSWHRPNECLCEFWN
jgi:hypothetical protein